MTLVPRPSVPRPRRRSAVGAALAVGLLSLATACGGAGSAAAPAAGSATGEPVPGGALTFAVGSEPLSLNPHVEGSHKAKIILRNVFDSYLFKAEDGSYHPWLAESFELDPEAPSITLHLREDVTFHDGTPLDAAAVVTNFEHLQDPEYSPTGSFLLRNLEGIETPDEHTVVLSLAQRDTHLLDLLAGVGSAPLSPASFETDSLQAGGPELAGTGPFSLAEYTRGQDLELERFTDYDWAPEQLATHDGAAYLDAVTFRFLPEAATRTGALSSEQVDVIEGVPPVDTALFEDDDAFTSGRILNNGAPYTYYLNVSQPPFDDIDVRRAFIQAVDVDTLVASIYQGTAQPATTGVSSASAFHDESAARPPYDPDAANALLDEAGWGERDAEGYRVKDGERLTVTTVASAPYIRESRELLGQAVSAQVKDSVGIDLRFEVADAGTAQNVLLDNGHQYFENSYATAEPSISLSYLYASGGVIPYGNYADAELDALVAEVSATADAEEQEALYSQIQHHITDQALSLPIYNPQDTWAARAAVHGLTTDPALGTIWSLYNVWKDS
ncbi:ABC transporter substrate-binding protein [Georgenia sp. Marseille-Q6866]